MCGGCVLRRRAERARPGRRRLAGPRCRHLGRPAATGRAQAEWGGAGRCPAPAIPIRLDWAGGGHVRPHRRRRLRGRGPGGCQGPLPRRALRLRGHASLLRRTSHRQPAAQRRAALTSRWLRRRSLGAARGVRYTALRPRDPAPRRCPACASRNGGRASFIDAGLVLERVCEGGEGLVPWRLGLAAAKAGRGAPGSREPVTRRGPFRS